MFLVEVFVLKVRTELFKLGFVMMYYTIVRVLEEVRDPMRRRVQPILIGV